MNAREDSTQGGAPPSGRDGEPPVSGELPAGAPVGDHVIERLIGEGAFGAVYLARRADGGGISAIKIMHTSLSVRPKAVERFVREVNVVRLLRHPGIVEIRDLGKLADGRPYYVMEYLEGEPLSALLARRGRVSPEEAADLLEPVGGALEAAHQAGVIHRDVKASNVLVCGEGSGPPTTLRADEPRRAPAAPRTVKLLDFGVAKLVDGPESASGFTTVGRTVGTLSAMAPEQILGGAVDARADVYALGILLYRLLTGHHPFWSADEIELAWRHIEEPAPRPSARVPVSPMIDAVVLRALEKSPDRRFPSAQAFFDALRDAAGGRRAAGPGGAALRVTAAVHVELDVDPPAGDELDARQVDDIGRVLDLAEESLRAGGFVVVLATGNMVLAIRPLAEEPEAGDAAAAVARALAGSISARPSADPRVRGRVRLHTAPALIRLSTPPEIIGGPLADLCAWPAESAISPPG
ncbi:MAG: serine/threonine protein kinase [Polyangiaceae bacterium]|nr:serine/threonine protein kinase [Polyangiaceae bacterium]